MPPKSIAPHDWVTTVKAFFDKISAIAATRITFSVKIATTEDPSAGDDVGNRDYNDGRYVKSDGSPSEIEFSNGAKLEVSGNTLVITDAP